MEKLPRYRTGDAELDRRVEELIDALPVDRNADLIFELVTSAIRLAQDGASRGDLKVANASLKELRYAFQVFAPYRAARKASIFGSARTRPDDPLYDQARRLASALAEHDWMIITGAGPGIMTAGIEGAGVDHAFGVSIRLPFEATTSEFLEGDPKLVNFRYFFTRKLTFVKESDGFALLPGGFGTLDEAFETLTLIQTGKAQPAPIVLLDVPGGTYWHGWNEFVEAELDQRGYISPEDMKFVLITDDVDVAVEELTSFYANYHSMRFVEGELVLRMHHAPEGAQLDALNDVFATIVTRGKIEKVGPSKVEIKDKDFPELERLRFRFDRRNWARIRELIDAVNEPYRSRSGPA
jgi:uncharacterized protein (TIGR00730 family)